jgi:hypothetical protein
VIEFDGELTEVRFRPDHTIERIHVVDGDGRALVIWLDPPLPRPEPGWRDSQRWILAQTIPRPRVRIERA